MEVSVVSTWSELTDSAVRLLASAGRDCPFSGDVWLELFSRQVAEADHELYYLLLNDNGNTVLVLPMMVQKKGNTKTLYSLSNYYTPYFSHVATSHSSATLIYILFELAAKFLKRFDAIELFPLTESTKDLLQQAAIQIGLSPNVLVKTHNWRQTGIQDFAQYWSTRDSRLRNTVQRKQRKIDARGEFNISVVVSAGIEKAISDYRSVYAQSWKPVENFPNFIDDLIRVHSRDDSLRLGLMHRGDTPVAAQIWIVKAGTAYIYKLAYDQKYEELSVGTLLTHALFKRAIDIDRVHTVDYLTGDDAYKSQWMSERRPLYQLTLANPRRPKGAALAIKHKLHQALE